ncbi:hypothetical protein ScalyP_jg3897 [Parmales sp. scaly parma]|nr:hypothetical protein ScalyP_jg3897 [Parmales sp. scaly parma]
MSLTNKLANNLFDEWRAKDEVEEQARHKYKLEAEELRSLGQCLLPATKLSEFQCSIEPSSTNTKLKQPTKADLALLLTWLSYDEDSFSSSNNTTNPAPFFSRAGAPICEAFAENNLRCLYLEGVDFPLAFAVTKDKNFKIDIMGVFTGAKRKGVGGLLVQAVISLIRLSKFKGRYEIDSLISSILFWRSCGFEVVPPSQIETEKMKFLEFQRPMFLEMK